MWGSDKDRGEETPAARSSKASNAVDTLIGRQSEVTGDVNFAGGLHLDGRVTGKVKADSDENAVLSVSESGSIEGDVHVPHVVLKGSIEGDVHASERVTLSAKARVNGNVHYKLIEMASGAMVNGQLVYEGEGGDKVAAAIPHKEKDAAGTAQGDHESASAFGAAPGKT